MLKRTVRKLVRVLPCVIRGPLLRHSCRIEESKADGVVFKIADTRDELEAAFRLVHDVYVDEGYSDVDRSGIRLNLRYALPTTTTFVGVRDGEVVITMTLISDSPFGLPMDEIFSGELCQLRRRGRAIAEVSAFASRPDCRRRGQILALFANKIMWRYATQHLGLDDLVIAVNPKHRWVYSSLLMFETMSPEVKQHRYVKDAAAVAMRLDLQSCLSRWRRAYRAVSHGRNLLDFFIADHPRHLSLPATSGPHAVWNDQLFNHFFESETLFSGGRRGSLEGLYRTLSEPGPPRNGSLAASYQIYIDEPAPIDPAAPISF